MPGGPAGPTGAGSYSITQDSAGVPGTAEREDAFGTTVRLADLTKDGRPELVVGTPGELAPGSTRSTGGIWTFKGTAHGPALSDVHERDGRRGGPAHDERHGVGFRAGALRAGSPAGLTAGSPAGEGPYRTTFSSPRVSHS